MMFLQAETLLRYTPGSLGLDCRKIGSIISRKKAWSSLELLQKKKKMRGSMMTLDLEDDSVSSVTEEVNRKIRKKKSGFSKLQKSSRSSIIDRRKRR